MPPFFSMCASSWYLRVLTGDGRAPSNKLSETELSQSHSALCDLVSEVSVISSMICGSETGHFIQTSLEGGRIRPLRVKGASGNHPGKERGRSEEKFEQDTYFPFVHGECLDTSVFFSTNLSAFTRD